MGASECAPPLMTFIIGTGSTLALGPPRYLNRGGADGCRGSVRVGQRHAQDGIGAELLFVFGAVEFDECLVERNLIKRIHTPQSRGDVVIHRVDRLLDALAEVTFLVAVA